MFAFLNLSIRNDIKYEYIDNININNNILYLTIVISFYILA